MTDTPKRCEELELAIFESGIMIQLHRVAGAQQMLSKQLVMGRCKSEIVGAVADLRHAANKLDDLLKEYRHDD